MTPNAVDEVIGKPRWFGVGYSSDPNPRVAGEEAVRAALQNPDPRLVIVFCASEYDVVSAVDAIASLTPGVPMIGCTTAGEISTAAVADQSITVSVLGGEFEVATRCARHADRNLFDAGIEAAEAIDDLTPSEHEVLLMLTDGLAGNQEEIVRGAYAHVGAATPLVGGCAGDGGRMVKTIQIIDGEVVDNSVVAAAIGSAAPIGIGVRHGWRAIGDPLMVTRSTGTDVLTLDGEPAIKKYLERSGGDPRLAEHPEEFALFAQTHPVGLRRRDAEEVRFISGADVETGAVVCVAEVPEGSLVWLMEGDVESVMEGTRDSCTEALGNLGMLEPLGVLLFDCIARRSVLGPQGELNEVATLQGLLPGVPSAGFYTYGEIARTSGVRGFHNQTLVTLAFA